MDAAAALATPAVSVIMATWNGARHIAASIDSVLDQTLRDWELIVGDDASTDGTAAILAAIADPRVRRFRNPRNLGVVGTRNACLALARAPFVAMLDHDDISRPTRLARQLDYLRRNEGVVLLGTAAESLTDGRVQPLGYPATTTPALLDWLTLFQNPLVCSSVMFRRDAVDARTGFMREEYRYADDFDFYARLRAHGRIARLDEPLTLYRLHGANAFRLNEDLMEANASRVLARAYAPVLGTEADRAATLVLRHLSSGKPVETAADLRDLRRVFDAIDAVARAPLDPGDRALADAHAARLWRRVLRATAGAGGVSTRVLLASHRPVHRLSLQDVPRALLPTARLRKTLPRLRPRRGTGASLQSRSTMLGMTCRPVAFDPSLPPSLFVVVDTEAEFDWKPPFSHDLVSVTAMDAIARGQEVFDRYGLKPIYVVDYPVSIQRRGSAPLEAILARDACEIGAHLHPWTTPPFEEELSPANSFPGNLPPSLEQRKLDTLLDAIEKTFGRRPSFYKAGRYGIGPATPALLASRGVLVDLSVLPGADLRPIGGPEFLRMRTGAARLADTGVLAVTMTRDTIGAWPRIPGAGRTAMRPFLARARLADTVTLTPEGVTAAEQKRLIRALMRRGERLFVLHFHSPSLAPGFTPYARDALEAAAIRDRIAEICRFFFEELGGTPGQPRHLLRLARADA